MPRILVVDDEPSIRQLLRTVLEGSGYEVMEAGNGAEAYPIAGVASIDLLVTDIVMPDKEGIELIQHFRKSLDYVKLTAISGEAYGQYLHMARMLGAAAGFSQAVCHGRLAENRCKPARPLNGHPSSRD
jgi:CheY-like chemotaxis protein